MAPVGAGASPTGGQSRSPLPQRPRHQPQSAAPVKLAPKGCCLLVLPRKGESGARWRMLMVRWVLLALLLALPITQSWLDLGKSAKDQPEPPGTGPIPSFCLDPSQGLQQCLARQAHTHLWLLSQVRGELTSGAGGRRQGRQGHSAQRWHLPAPGSWFAAPTIPTAPANLRGEGRLQEIAGSVTMEEEPVI